MSAIASGVAPLRRAPSARRIDWRSLGRAALWFAGVYAAIAVLYGIQEGIGSAGPVDWPRVMSGSAVCWGASAVASIPLAWLAWRQPLDVKSFYRALPLYVAGLGLAIAIRFFLFAPMEMVFFGNRISIGSEFRSDFVPEFVALMPVIAIVLLVRYLGEIRRRELRTAQLEGELTAARLEALQTQLHPHFLFNTLHCVSTLMRRNVDEADEMLVRLCDLLRLTLERPEHAEIPLGDELAILERYLDIMEMRFPNRLRVRIDVPPELRNTPVPALLLQPLVENVLRHGLDETHEITDVVISAVRSEAALLLRVTDSGRGLPTHGPPRFGTGLENTRRRLETLYGPGAALQIRNVAPRGTEVALVIPEKTLV